jgi:hypothetical protein
LGGDVAAYIIRFLLVCVYVCVALFGIPTNKDLIIYAATSPHTDVFQLIILTTVTLASSNNALHDDGDCTETCRSCFNVNFNVNFKIVFKKIQLCISWWMGNLDSIKMHRIYVENNPYMIPGGGEVPAARTELHRRGRRYHIFQV